MSVRRDGRANGTLGLNGHDDHSRDSHDDDDDDGTQSSDNEWPRPAHVREGHLRPSSAMGRGGGGGGSGPTTVGTGLAGSGRVRSPAPSDPGSASLGDSPPRNDAALVGGHPEDDLDDDLDDDEEDGDDDDDDAGPYMIGAGARHHHAAPPASHARRPPHAASSSSSSPPRPAHKYTRSSTDASLDDGESLNLTLPRSSGDAAQQAELESVFAHIKRYKPQILDLDTELKPFVPDYIPAIGDIDGMIKIARPDGEPTRLGLGLVDEPAPQQSDPAALVFFLRNMSKTLAPDQTQAVHTLTAAEVRQNPKRIDGWLSSIKTLHQQQPPPSVQYTAPMPEIDDLMQQWPRDVERTLRQMLLPDAGVPLAFKDYAALVAVLLDIPVRSAHALPAGAPAPAGAGKTKETTGLIEALHLVFSLFSEFQNSGHFRPVLGPGSAAEAAAAAAAGAPLGAGGRLGSGASSDPVGSDGSGMGGMAMGASAGHGGTDGGSGRESTRPFEGPLGSSDVLVL